MMGWQSTDLKKPCLQTLCTLTTFTKDHNFPMSLTGPSDPLLEGPCHQQGWASSISCLSSESLNTMFWMSVDLLSVLCLILFQKILHLCSRALSIHTTSIQESLFMSCAECVAGKVRLVTYWRQVWDSRLLRWGKGVCLPTQASDCLGPSSHL